MRVDQRVQELVFISENHKYVSKLPQQRVALWTNPEKVLQRGDRMHGHDSISKKEWIVEKDIFCKWHIVAIWRQNFESWRFTVMHDAGKKDVKSRFSAVWETGREGAGEKNKYNQSGGTRMSLSLCGKTINVSKICKSNSPSHERLNSTFTSKDKILLFSIRVLLGWVKVRRELWFHLQC